jgi:hypothetical protein
MNHEVLMKLTTRLMRHIPPTSGPADTEAGFEIAQSMGIALLGLVVAAGFATLLEALGVEIVTNIRQQLGM